MLGLSRSCLGLVLCSCGRSASVMDWFRDGDMSETVVCRHCEEKFIPQPGKPGYRDECPVCLMERKLLAAKPDKSKLEEHFAAAGLTKEQIAMSVHWFRRVIGKTLRDRWGCSEEEAQQILDGFEDSPTLGKR